MDEVAFGRYRLVALIGEGGMGKVYRARDTVIDREVAIKVLSPEMANEPGYEERFRREAQAAARLNEPHIVPVFDAGEIDGRLYLVMPVIKGTNVHELLEREGPMSPQRAVHIVEQLAAALDAAHASGLVHRDIKPSNALVTGRDFTYLIDFGIARSAQATKLTNTGMLVGTLAYMAPERFTAGSADSRSDVYALACVLHECLTGAQPFPGDSMEQQIAGHLTQEPPRPSAQNPYVPAGFDEVIARGMAKDPAARYQSAAELATAAHQALTGEPARFAAVEPHSSAPQPVRHPPRSSPEPAPATRPRLRPAQLGGIIAVVGVVVLLATAGITYKLAQPNSSTSQTPATPTSGPAGSGAPSAPPTTTTPIQIQSTHYVKLTGMGMCEISTSDAVCEGSWPQAPAEMDQALVDTSGTLQWRSANLGSPSGGRHPFEPTVGQPYHGYGWTVEADGSGNFTFTYDSTHHGMKITKASGYAGEVAAF